MKAIDFMVDLETLDNNPTAVIVQIGCVAYERETGEEVATFRWNVDAEDELRNGFTVNGSTIEWWMQQALDGQCSWLGASIGGKDMLQRFSKFVREHSTKKSVMWSHSTFDAPILFYHFNKYNMSTPIKYSFWLDLRTLSMLGRGVAAIPKEARPEDAHDALADCRYQVKWAVKCWKALHGK